MCQAVSRARPYRTLSPVSPSRSILRGYVNRILRARITLLGSCRRSPVLAETNRFCPGVQDQPPFDFTSAKPPRGLASRACRQAVTKPSGSRVLVSASHAASVMRGPDGHREPRPVQSKPRRAWSTLREDVGRARVTGAGSSARARSRARVKGERSRYQPYAGHVRLPRRRGDGKVQPRCSRGLRVCATSCVVEPGRREVKSRSSPWRLPFSCVPGTPVKSSGWCGVVSPDHVGRSCRGTPRIGAIVRWGPLHLCFEPLVCESQVV